MSMKIFFRFWKVVKAKLFDAVIDGFKVHLNIEHFSEQFLEDTFPLYVKHGEILNTQNKIDYHGLKLILFPEKGVLIRGSLHRYYNNGGTNHDRFTFEDCKKAMDRLSKNITPEIVNAPLQNFEFGHNVETDQVSNILRAALLYKSRPFLYDESYRYLVCKMSDQVIKMYDKAYNCNLKEKILRIEKRLINARQIQRLGIRCLGDIQKKEIQESLIQELNEVVDNCTFIDPFLDVSALSHEDKLVYHEYSNPNSWINSYLNRHQKKRKKLRLSRIAKKCGQEEYGDLLKTLINKTL